MYVYVVSWVTFSVTLRIFPTLFLHSSTHHHFSFSLFLYFISYFISYPLHFFNPSNPLLFTFINIVFIYLLYFCYTFITLASFNSLIFFFLHFLCLRINFTSHHCLHRSPYYHTCTHLSWRPQEIYYPTILSFSSSFPFLMPSSEIYCWQILRKYVISTNSLDYLSAFLLWKGQKLSVLFYWWLAIKFRKTYSYIQKQWLVTSGKL